MVSYTTLDELRLWSSERRSELRKSLDSAEARRPDGATFLSHSSKDDEFVPMVVKILENHGATVYVDKGDPTLEESSARNIAKILRSRIKACRKFVMFASTNSKDSRWVPWELGLADGGKSSDSVALFPAVDKAGDTKWAETEYLAIYDRIVWGEINGYPKPMWMVWNQEANSAIPLTKWLA